MNTQVTLNSTKIVEDIFEQGNLVQMIGQPEKVYIVGHTTLDIHLPYSLDPIFYGTEISPKNLGYFSAFVKRAFEPYTGTIQISNIK